MPGRNYPRDSHAGEGHPRHAGLGSGLRHEEHRRKMVTYCIGLTESIPTPVRVQRHSHDRVAGQNVPSEKVLAGTLPWIPSQKVLAGILPWIPSQKVLAGTVPWLPSEKVLAGTLTSILRGRRAYFRRVCRLTQAVDWLRLITCPTSGAFQLHNRSTLLRGTCGVTS